MSDDFRDIIRGERARLTASNPLAQARPQPVADPPALMTDLDKQRIAETWWAGALNIGDMVELESGKKLTCCAIEIGRGAPPHLTFRLMQGSGPIRVVIDVGAVGS